MGIKYSKVSQKIILSVLVILSLTACSQNKTTQSGGSIVSDDGVTSEDSTSGSVDSLEKFNRSIYSFNVGLDKYLLKPIAKGYKAVTPEFVDTSVTNFFSNLGDVENVVNNLLQFKVDDAINDTERRNEPTYGFEFYCCWTNGYVRVNVID